MNTRRIPCFERNNLKLWSCYARTHFAQAMTFQDSHDFEVWLNPFNHTFITMADDFLTIGTAENDDEFVTELRRLVAWHREHGGFYGIDTDADDMIAKIKQMQLGDLLF